MNIVLKSITYLFFIILFSSCQDKEISTDQNLKVELKNPADSTEYMPGDTVYIYAKLSNIIPIHGYEISIYGMENLQMYFYDAKHFHQNEIIIDTFFVNQLDTFSLAKFELRAYHSHSEGPFFLNRFLLFY
jgi:hypothetical protein